MKSNLSNLFENLFAYVIHNLFNIIKLLVLKSVIGCLILYKPQYRPLRHEFDIENVLVNFVLGAGCAIASLVAAIYVFDTYKTLFRVLPGVKSDSLKTIVVKLFTKGKLNCKHAFRKSATGM